MAHRTLGNLTLSRAVEMTMRFDARRFFPDTTDEDWEPHRRWLEPDAMEPGTGALRFPIQSYVVRTTRHTILVDACVGNHKERPYRPDWHRRTGDDYPRALAACGIAPEAVDFVLCTHLHGDHVGWNTRLEDGRWVPTFPNARYVFSRREVEVWRDEGHPTFSRAPFEDSVLPVLEAGRADLVTNDHALDDEVWLEPAPGHTPDHVAVRLASRGERAVLVGDALHSPVQCRHPEWRPWPDWDPELAARTRRRLLEQSCDTDVLVCTAHFPLPSAGRVVRDGEAFGFEYDPVPW